MTRAAGASDLSVAWWKEPTKDQWLAWWAAWLGWTLDAFDFTMFLLIMVPISQEFHVPLTDVAFVLSVTLWLGSSAPWARAGSPTGSGARSR